MINILLVDDHLDNVEMLSSALEQDNITCYSTTSPLLALQLCIDHDINIALIDVNMPHLSGYDLLKSIKNNALIRDIMVVLMTGYSMETGDVVKGLTLGAVDYLFKPLDLHVTVAKVNSIIKIILQQREISSKNFQLEQYQKRLIEAVSAAEQNKLAKENFLANMSHELRTPLNAILGLIHILEKTNQDAEQTKIIEMLTYSSRLLLDLVNDILDLSRIDAGKLKINKIETDLTRLVNDVCDLSRPMAESKGLTLTSNVDDNIPEVIMADTLRLNQILINLINNAIKFTSYGTIKLLVSIAKTEDSRVLLSFSVVDTGIGIPQEVISQIFSRYERLENTLKDKFGSTGLGLPIVKKLVDLKGGELHVQSSVGIGTTFTFTNWYDVRNTMESSHRADDEVQNFKPFLNLSILLVDDDEINRFVTFEILSHWDVKVDEAENGFDAVNKAILKKYDIILMDLNMPILNGIEATIKIRQESSGINRYTPIAAFSASINKRDKIDGEMAGIEAYIQKPISPENLYLQISALLNRSKL